MRTKILMTLTALVALSPLAQAEDVYNFYFQKSGNKKKQEVVQEKEEIVEEADEEVVVVPNDVLLVPDNWSPVRKKKKYVRQRDVEEEEVYNEIKSKKKKEKKGRRGSGWSMNLGIGGVETNNGISVSQKTYVIGSRYHMSRYFDVNGEIHLANGDYEYGGSSFKTGDSMGPQAMIGLGVTPIHLNVFGGEFLEIGIDGGVAFGDRYALNPYAYGYQDSDTGNALYLGPRVAVNFGDHMSLIYSLKKDIDSASDFSIHSLALSYRW